MNRKNNTGIARKEKACCANCKNIGICVLPSSECNYCSLYKGNGATPEQTLKKLKKHIAGLKAKLKQYQNNSASYSHTDGHETNMPITVNGVEIAPEAISEILEDGYFGLSCCIAVFYDLLVILCNLFVGSSRKVKG